jgi:hypothetical protein
VANDQSSDRAESIQAAGYWPCLAFGRSAVPFVKLACLVGRLPRQRICTPVDRTTPCVGDSIRVRRRAIMERFELKQFVHSIRRALTYYGQRNGEVWD